MSARDHIESIHARWLPSNSDALLPLQKLAERQLKNSSDDLYTKDSHFIVEFIQNADDNTYLPGITPTLRIRLEDDTITISSNERGFSEAEVEALCSANESTKAGKKAEGFIGEKGIGFKSAFKVADVIHISSKDYKFKFDRRGLLGMIVPIWDSDAPAVAGETVFTLDLSGQASSLLAAELTRLEPSLLLFMRHLRILHVDVRTTSPPISISATYTYLEEQARGETFPRVYTKCEMVEAGVRRIFGTTYRVLKETVPMTGIDEPKRLGVGSSQLTLAFPIQSDGSPYIASQNIFAFLPLASVGFKFIIQADFLTASNRQDILEDSPWNCRLRDQIPAVFARAVHYFLTEGSKLQFAWPLYLSGDVTHHFFNLAMNSLVNVLKQRPVVKDASQVPKLVSQVFVLPAHFRLGQSPLVLSEFLPNQRYLHGGYAGFMGEPTRALERRFRLTTMQDSDFFDGLWNMSNARAFSSQSSDWHRAVASQLYEICDRNDSLSRRVRNLWIIPLTGRRVWTSTAQTPIFLPVNRAVMPLLPPHLQLRIVDPEATSVPERRRFYERMGVRDASIPDVATCILATQAGLDAASSVSNARFFFTHRGVEHLPDQSELLFAVEGGGALRGHQIYFDDERNHGHLRRALQDLRPPRPFLSPLYLSPDSGIPAALRSEWRSWLSKTCKIHPDPDEDLPTMAEQLPLTTFLRCLKYFGPRYSSTTSTWRSALADKVILVNGTQVRFRDTYVPRGTPEQLKGLMEDIGLPVLPVVQPEDTDWDFLSKYGISIGLDAKLCLRLLVHLSRSQSDTTVTSFSCVQELYAQLGARFMDDPVATRKSFIDDKLILIPADENAGRKAAQWLGTGDRIFWDGPESLVFHQYLRRFYRKTLRTFFSRVGISSAPPDAVLQELRRLSTDNSYAGQALDPSAQATIFALLEDLFDMSGQEQIPDSSIRRLIEEAPIFPARVNKGGKNIVRLYSLNQVYVPGRQKHFTKAFQNYVPLLIIPPSGPKTMTRFLASSICFGVARWLDDCVLSTCTPSDSFLPDEELSGNIRQKYKYIEREVIRSVTQDGRRTSRKLSSRQTTFLSKLKEAEILRVDDIEAKLILGAVTVCAKENVWIDDSCAYLRAYILHRGAGIAPRDDRELQDRLYGEIARRLSVGPREILPIMVCAVENVNRFTQYDEDILPSLKDLQEPSKRSTSGQTAIPSPTRQAGPSSAPAGSSTGTSMPAAPTAEPFAMDVDQLEPKASGNHIKQAAQTALLKMDFAAMDPRVHQSSPTRLTNPSLPSAQRSDLPPYELPHASTSATRMSRAGELDWDMDTQMMEEPASVLPSLSSMLPIAQPAVAGAPPKLNQKVNGVIGEKMVYEFLSNRLGRDAAGRCWTSELRGKADVPGLSEYVPDDSILGDFTIADSASASQFCKYILQDRPKLLGAYAGSGNWPKFHLEVKATSDKSASAPFHLRRRQFEIARQLHSSVFATDRPEEVSSLPKEIYVLVRVWDVQNPTPSLDKVAFHVDPFEGLLNGELKIASDSVEVSFVNGT